MRIAAWMLMLSLLLAAAPAGAEEFAVLETSRGPIKIRLDGEKAPESVKNFIAYAKAGFYDGTIFHRVISDFMIQGGGYTAELTRKETRPPIANEAGNGLRNERGTIAMARTQVVDSATSQFFINLKDNAFLDHQGKSPSQFGYAVFGRVVEGMEVVDAIAATPVKSQGPQFQNLPVTPVVIEKVRIETK